jgi:hypothetical protein
VRWRAVSQKDSGRSNPELARGFVATMGRCSFRASSVLVLSFSAAVGCAPNRPAERVVALSSSQVLPEHPDGSGDAQGRQGHQGEAQSSVSPVSPHGTWAEPKLLSVGSALCPLPTAQATDPVAMPAFEVRPAPALGRALASVSARTTARSLLDQFAVHFEDARRVPVDGAARWQTVRDALDLGPATTELLSRRGFVVLERPPNDTYDNFVQAYTDYFNRDLPVYISADSILFVVHALYDSLLSRVEEAWLAPLLDEILRSMQRRLAARKITPETRHALDLYLTGALELLNARVPIKGVLDDPSIEKPSPALHDSACDSQLQALIAAVRSEKVRVAAPFGRRILLDGNDFVPRGHYADSPALARYFQATKWLNLLKVPLLESAKTEGGTRRVALWRDQLELAVALHGLVDEEAARSLRLFERLLGALSGPNLGTGLADAGTFVAALGGTRWAASSDTELIERLARFNATQARLSPSDWIALVHAEKPAPMLAFSPLGPRRTPDADLVRVMTWLHRDDARTMPSPLDVAFGLLGNDQALTLYDEPLQSDELALRLLAARRGVSNSKPRPGTSLLSDWMEVLRTLSPASSSPKWRRLPQVARTETWGRRLLETQLASWAEFRYDTILYEPPHMYGIGCSFPDVYVDPYPDFYSAVERLARGASSIARELVGWAGAHPTLGATADLREWFESIAKRWTQLAKSSATLGVMAQRQLRGEPVLAEHLRFINRSLTEEVDCDEVTMPGWYVDLVGFEPDQARVVADVFIEPTDADGSPTGRVLHVGTGDVRTMVVAVAGPTGPRVFVGPTSSYYELIAEQVMQRSEWQESLNQHQIEAPGWVKAHLVTR